MPSKIFETFAGEEVQIITNAGKKGNVVFSGTLLEEDEEHFYLGKVSTGIFAAVKKSEYVGITLGQVEESNFNFEVQ